MTDSADTTAASDAPETEEIPLFPIQFSGVRLVELHAQTSESGEGLEPAFSIELIGEPEPHTREFTELLRFHIRMVGDGCIELTVALEGQFEVVPELDTIDYEMVRRFVARRAVPTIWPYMREVVHYVTEQMDLGVPLLPVLDTNRLEFTFEVEQPIGSADA